MRGVCAAEGVEVVAAICAGGHDGVIGAEWRKVRALVADVSVAVGAGMFVEEA